jgi:SAM-dependent methyltransferase
MGFDIHAIRFLQAARASGVSFHRVATIGRQKLDVTAPQLRAFFRRCDQNPLDFDVDNLLTSGNGFAEPLLRLLGAGEICSVDASTYEGATTIHDLNLPIPTSLRNRFTAVIDGGSLEHVFDFPVALKSCLEMVTEGGHFISFSPGNNWFGHGFYQFSPELYFRVLCPDNGFVLQRVIVCETTPDANWYQVTDPAATHRRLNIVGFRRIHVLVQAQRVLAVPVLCKSPQQSDYLEAWNGSTHAGTSRGRLRSGLARALGPLYQRHLRNALRLCFPFWTEPGFFHKVDWTELLHKE